MSDIDALIAGFKAFHEEYLTDTGGRYRALASYGAHARILMIACCDSRTDPAIITNSSAGDLMVIRNMANLVPPFEAGGRHTETQAALEFAVCYLKVQHIIIMGHSRCGGIRSLLVRLIDDFDPERQLDRWMAVAEPAARDVLARMPGEDLDLQACACARGALGRSLENLRSYPWISSALAAQALQLHGWYFNLSNGDLERYLPLEQGFESLY